MLCQRKMNNPQKITCGQLLWKTLCILWKSYGFPQVKAFFSDSAPRNVMNNPMHKILRNESVTMLRHRENLVTILRKTSKKLENTPLHFLAGSLRQPLPRKFL